MRTGRWVGVVVCLVLAMSAGASAQETTGTITGAVSDQTGAILPGVTVLVRQIATGRTWEFVSNEAGRYAASLLPPGDYEITFSLTGFQPVTVKGIQLHVNDRLEVNGKLGVGAVQESVEVTAASSFVQPTPAVQGLIAPTQVQELPINNRSFVQLATLVPGVSSDLADEVNFGLTNVVSLSINGARRNAVNWLLDGASNVDVGSNVTLLATPTLESIEEFKIITSSYAAEWPRSGGGVINVVTKSGTSEFHGSAYEFLRHDKLNANSFFRNLSSDPALNSSPARLRYNNFGYTIGGPVLPWREKAFFFWSQEWRRINRAPGSLVANVPAPDTLTNPANPNYVPPDQRDPNAVRLFEAWPQPNAPNNQFINSAPNFNNTRQEVIRVDYDLNPAWRLTGRYTHDLSQTQELGGLFFNSVVPGIATTNTDVPGEVAVVQVKTIIGSNKLNELSYQFSHNKISTSNPDGTRNTRDQFGVTIGELFPENAGNRIPTINVSGLSLFGATQPINIEYFNHTFTDNLSWQMGNHSFKGGFLLAFEQKNENAANPTQGRFDFVAGGGRTALQNFLIGNRDGRCGAACTYMESEIDVTNHLRFNRYEFYVQDSWRVRPNMTLDAGVRYSLYPPVTDTNDILSTFVPALYDPARRPTFGNASGSVVVVGTGDPLNGIIVAGVNSPHGRKIYGFDKNTFQPRLGFSWDPGSNGQTIVRGAYGVYFDQPLVGIFEQNAFVNPPYANSVTVQNPSLSAPGSGVPAGTTAVRNLQATSDPFDTPRTQQWNVGVQRQVYSRGSLEVSYVGSRGDDLIQPVQINLAQPEDADAVNGNNNLVRPFLGYGTITMRQTTAYANYHGLLTSFRHEGGRSGSLTVNYTLSRNRTTSTNDRDAVDIPQNPLDLEAEYADARTDRRHIFNANYIYELPFFRNSDNLLARATLGGWQAAGIVNIASGPPIPRVIVSSTNSDQRGIRLNQVGDPQAGDLEFPFWFNPAAFAPAAEGTYGTVPRAPFRLPGRHQWDFSLSKNWYAPHDLRVQFRADFINAFNHTQWSLVDATCTAGTQADCSLAPNTTFGQITGTRLPREIQLSLKLYW